MRKESGFNVAKKGTFSMTGNTPLKMRDKTVMFRRLESENHLSHWLMKIEGFEETPEKQQVMIDGIHQLPAPLFLPF